jgi:trimethylamine--corrinoid protein Co-methyltransferase
VRKQPRWVAPWRVLTDAEMERLHGETTGVLEKVGVDVHDAEARKLLRGAGAKLDGDRAYIPRELVDEALRAAPGEITVYDREGEPTMQLRPGYVYFGPGSDVTWVIDPASGERRPTDLDSIRMMSRLVDALPNVDFTMSMGIAPEIEPGRADQHHFAAMVESTAKPPIFTAQTPRAMREIAEMAAVVRGGKEAFREKPFAVLYAMPTSPLYHTHEALQNVLVAADYGIPCIYSSGAMGGVSAPISTAGFLVVAHAEMLSGLVVHQLARPGAPFVGAGVLSWLDMRTTVNYYNGPDVMLIQTATVQMTRDFYHLPTFATGGCSDAKSFDQQAAMEAATSLMSSALCGGNLVHDVGYLESGLCASPELLVYCDEVIDQMRFLLGGFPVDDESLAVEDIARAGPHGSFIEDELTLKRFRRDCWYPRLFERGNYERWQQAGGKMLGERVRQETLRILAEHRPPPLPEAVQAEMWRIARGE